VSQPRLKPVESAPLDDDPAFHIEQSISALHDAIWRVIRGIEVLDLSLISDARAKLDAADRSLIAAIKARKAKG
jgi:hypothetical protein